MGTHSQMRNRRQVTFAGALDAAIARTQGEARSLLIQAKILYRQRDYASTREMLITAITDPSIQRAQRSAAMFIAEAYAASLIADSSIEILS